jgi:hypothetical protein
MDKVKAFFETPASNMVGICIGGALVGTNIVNFTWIGFLAGVFLIIAEGIQYWERAGK